jgi:hypothetical protein
MADLSTLRDSLGEVEYVILSNWAPFQCELFIFSRDTDGSSPGTVEITRLRGAARAERGQYISHSGVTFR